MRHTSTTLNLRIAHHSITYSLPRTGERMCFGARIVELCGQTVHLVNVQRTNWTFKCMATMCVWRRRRTKHKVLKLPFQTVIRGFHVRAVHTPNNSIRCSNPTRIPWTDMRPTMRSPCSAPAAPLHQCAATTPLSAVAADTAARPGAVDSRDSVSMLGLVSAHASRRSAGAAGRRSSS